MNDVTAELKKRSDSFQLQCVEGVNNVLDYIEFSLENYTLPPSEEGKIAKRDRDPRRLLAQILFWQVRFELPK